VGSEPGVLFENISMGYAVGSGGACSNLAFNGSLNLNGLFGNCIVFYHVLAGDWTGGGGLLTADNPARGGVAPVTYDQVSLPTQLVDTVTIWREATASWEYDNVILGPFSFAGLDNLYMTRYARQNPTLFPLPASVIAQIGAFPTVALPDLLLGWANPNLLMTVPAGDLIAPQATGGVSLTIAPFDLAGTPIPTTTHTPLPPGWVEMGPNLVLMIDTTALSQTTIDWVNVYNADGSKATPTSSSTTTCPAYQVIGSGYVLIHTTVVDNAGQLYEYMIQTQYGSGSYLSATPVDRDYAQSVTSFTPPGGGQLYGIDPGYGIPNDFPPPPPPPQVPAASNWTYVGGGDTILIPITESCCYDFQLWAGKRTTDGETYSCTWYNPTFQTVNITVVPASE
jgi:hypothetical protein